MFRLYQVLAPGSIDEVPPPVKKDMMKFVSRMKGETVDLQSLGLSGTDLHSVLADIRSIYGLE